MEEEPKILKICYNMFPSSPISLSSSMTILPNLVYPDDHVKNFLKKISYKTSIYSHKVYYCEHIIKNTFEIGNGHNNR